MTCQRDPLKRALPVETFTTAVDEYYMNLAIEWSRRGMENGNLGPIGAVIVKQGRVIGQGHNRCQADLDITAHGEMVAIRDGIKNTGRLDGLQGATLYTTAQPCPMCYTACRWAGITRIVYALSCRDTYEIGSEFGFNDEALYHDLQQPEAMRAVPQSQLLRKEALPVLQQWVDELRQQQRAGVNDLSEPGSRGREDH